MRTLLSWVGGANATLHHQRTPRGIHTGLVPTTAWLQRLCSANFCWHATGRRCGQCTWTAAAGRLLLRSAELGRACPPARAAPSENFCMPPSLSSMARRMFLNTFQRYCSGQATGTQAGAGRAGAGGFGSPLPRNPPSRRHGAIRPAYLPPCGKPAHSHNTNAPTLKCSAAAQRVLSYLKEGVPSWSGMAEMGPYSSTYSMLSGTSSVGVQ